MNERARKRTLNRTRNCSGHLLHSFNWHVFIACLSVLIMIVNLLPAMHVQAAGLRYTGDEKVRSYEAITTFTEDDVEYRVTKRPSGSSKGEAYASGGTYRKTKLTIPATVKHGGSSYKVIGINDGAFCNYENLEKVTIADGVTYIGGGAFWGCYYMTSISIPASVNEIGQEAFAYCHNLKSISFPDNLKKIPFGVCQYSGVEDIKFGSKVTEIESIAFYECHNLKKVSLPKSVKTIGDGAFGDCYNLAAVSNTGKLSEYEQQSIFGNTLWYLKKSSSSDSGTMEHYENDLKLKVTIDGIPASGKYLYYDANIISAVYYGLLYDNYEDGISECMKTDAKGICSLDKKYVESSGSPLSGMFYLTDKKTKNFREDYIAVFNSYELTTPSQMTSNFFNEAYKEADRIREAEGEEAYSEYLDALISHDEYYEKCKQSPTPVDLITVKFVDGDVPAAFMPETQTFLKTSNKELGVFEDMYFNSMAPLTNALSGGYALAYYADEKGRRVTRANDLKDSTVLHPVFVNEQDLSKDLSFIEANSYRFSNYVRAENYSSPAQHIKVKTPAQLFGRIMDREDKHGLLIISSDMVIDGEALAKFAKTNDYAKEYVNRSSSGTYYCPNNNDFLIIENGATVTFDGLYITSTMNISVHSGSTLNITGKTKIEGNLGVQKNATVNIVDGTFSGNIMNNGTINVPAPAYKNASDSFGHNSLSATVFHNSSTGVINLNYGSLSLSNGFDKDYGPGYTAEDGYGEHDAISMNDGTINIKELGHISYTDWQPRDQVEAYVSRHFYNNGLISIVADRKKAYDLHYLDVRNTTLVNKGTIKIKSNVMIPYRTDLFAANVEVYDDAAEAVVNFQEAELINDGKIDIDVTDGVGINVFGDFFPRDRVNTHIVKDGDLDSHSKLVNNGTVTVTTNDGCGLAFGRHAYFINNGKVTLKEKAKNTRNASLYVAGKLINNGTLTNNGNIAFAANELSSADKKYPLDIGLSGKKIKGTGGQMLLYPIDITSADLYKNDYNIYITAGKRVLCDGTSEWAHVNHLWVLLPVDSKEKITVKLSGFADKTVEFSTAKSVADYAKAAYNGTNGYGSGLKPIKVSMTRGKGTADSSVTKRPESVGTFFYIGEYYYTVLTSDLKGGTVMLQYAPGNSTSIVVPDTIKHNGYTYKVTQLADGIFWSGNTATSITIGKYVESIGTNAFLESSNLKKVVINSSSLLKDACGKYAFEGIPASATVVVPAAKLKDYKKWFCDKGLGTKVKITSK